jgi:hypothetical protein
VRVNDYNWPRLIFRQRVQLMLEGHDRDNELKLVLSNFLGTEDAHKVKEFLLGREQWQSLPDYWTAGKSTVGTFRTIFDSPTSHHKFWRDANGEFHAYVWLHTLSQARRLKAMQTLGEC